MTQHKDNRYHNIRRVFEEHHKKHVEKFLDKHLKTLERARRRGLTLAGAAVLTTAILAGAPSQIKTHDTTSIMEENLTTEGLIKRVKEIISEGNSKGLSLKQEQDISRLLSAHFKVRVTSTLQGNKLNDVYGYIGQEQHLYRWAGDSLSQHDLQYEGIAPLKGSFGYFDNAEQEKYYVAVQLHELENWNRDWPVLKPWYRFRKVFVYNPDNGRGVVAVIGDSGPAMWTGKVFGGSPEVMNYLQRVDGRQKGKVVILFVDDPGNQVALGPVDLAPKNVAKK